MDEAIKRRLSDKVYNKLIDRTKTPTQTHRNVQQRIINSSMPLKDNIYLERLGKMYRVIERSDSINDIIN